MLRRLSILLTLALLTGCSSVREVRVLVRDAQSPGGAEPAAGVHVRAISLDSGTVPLPLDGDTIDEILSSGAVMTSATTNHAGEARMRLRGRVPYVLELLPPPLGPSALPAGEVAPPSRFVLAKNFGPVRRADDAPGPATYLVEVQR